jgi:hypothetical protein
MARRGQAAYIAGMTPNLLRASSLATLAATMLSFGAPQGLFADGRGDWDGYAWQRIGIADCTRLESTLQCPPYRQKWDWKRNQWVDIAITLDLAEGRLHLDQRLTDDDRNDDDHVCVTALAVDADGGNVVAHHQNWHMRPRSVREESFSYASTRLDQIAAIHIGSKQCREGPGQDDALYARVLAGIAP